MSQNKLSQVNTQLQSQNVTLRQGMGGYAFHFDDTKIRLEEFTTESIENLTVAQLVSFGNKAPDFWS